MSGAAEPRVAVCIPTYNRAELVRGAIKSAIDQDFADLVVVVSDNASQDNTEVVVNSIGDPRIRYERRDRNYGLIDNLNHVMTGGGDTDFVVLLNDDDRLLPGSIGRAVAALDEHPTAGFVHTTFDLIDKEARVIARSQSWSSGSLAAGLEPGAEFIRRALPVGCRVCTATAMFRRNALPDIPMNPDDGFQHDIVLTLTIARDHDVMFLSTPGAAFRVHEEADSSGFGVNLSGDGYAYHEQVILRMRELRLRWINQNAARLEDPAALRRIVRAGTVSMLLGTSRAAPNRSTALAILERAVRHQPEALLRLDVWRRAAGIISGRRQTIVGPSGAPLKT